jgi:hypothetical protein
MGSTTATVLAENKKKSDDRIYQLAILMGAACIFLLTFYIANIMTTVHAPDEYMRIEIPKWIVAHGALPHGDEKALINAQWGFSYGYTPYLPSLIAVLFMKITALFTTNAGAMLVAARFVSVLAIVVTWFACCAIGDRMFERRVCRILFAVMCCCLPQFIFLGSYFNNDAFGVMCTALITLAWLRGDQDGWTVKSAVLLAVPIGLLALTYYNDYAFILCSILFYFASAIRKKMPAKKILLLALLITVIVFAIAGWFFIRNYLIHDGDFLGMRSLNASGQKYAEEQYKPTNRNTPEHLGWSWYDMIFRSGWLLFTIQSFIGMFGYAVFHLPSPMYWVYSIGVLLLLALMLVRVIRDRRFPKKLFFCLVICIVVPVFLSMHYSYYTDYQPQGRYIMSALIPLMLFCTYGVDGIVCRIGKKRPAAAPVLPAALMVYEIGFSILAVAGVLIPNG